MRKLFYPTLSTVFLIGMYLGGCEQPKNSHDLILRNVNVVDVHSGEIREGQTVLIDSGRISSIQVDDLLNYEGKIIDGNGKYLIPGLWDMHVHFRGGDSLIEENKKLLPLYISHGVTGVRDAGGDLTPAIHSWQESIRQGEFQGPLIFTSGPKLDGPDARWAGSLEVTTRDQIKTALDSLQSLNVDYVKIYDSKISRESYLAILEEAGTRGLPTSGHMPFTVLLQEALDRNIHSIEHLYYVLKGCSSEEEAITLAVRSGELGFWGSFKRLMATYDSTIAQNTFKSMIAHNTYVVPTLHIGHTLSYLDENDHSSDDFLKYVGPGIQKTYRGRVESAQRADAEGIESRHQLHQTFRNLTLEMAKAGVGILAGTDGGAYNSYIYPGQSIHEELKIMVESGLSPAEALQTATINGAIFMNRDQDYGSVSTGKIADLVLLNGNPIKNINHTKDIEALIHGGNYISKKELSNLREKSIIP